MKTQFDSILEGQKNIFNLWTETARKMSEGFAPESPSSNGKDIWQDWLETQKAAWEDLTKMNKPEEAFAKAPDQMKKWAKAQGEQARKWTAFYKENAEKLGFKTPEMEDFLQTDFLVKTQQKWQDWTKETMKDLTDKLPFSQQFHLDNFNALYEAMYGYWEPMRKMIEFGIADWEGIGRFIPLQQYNEIIGKFIGYKPVKDIHQLLDQANAVFEKHLGLFKQNAGTAENWMKNWKNLSEQMGSGGSIAPLFPAILEIHHAVKEGLDKLFNLAGQSHEAEMAKLINDLRFAYTAFLLKSAEMQVKVSEASQDALPEAIKTFNEGLKKEKALPDFQEFFTLYINNLENGLLKLMEEKTYAALQSELSKHAATVKGKLDELTELAFADSPILTSSFSKEVAQETAALRKKIRSLEGRLTELEAPSGNKTTAVAEAKKAAKN